MKIDNSFSLAIVTKNRPKELARCLFSISRQTILPKEIIIIDNDQRGSALQTISFFKDKLNVSYIQHLENVPSCRNIALKKTKTKYLGFIDDDCVLTRNWAKIGLNSLRKNQTVYVLGFTCLLNPGNAIALASHARDLFWKEYNFKQNSENLKDLFDTKNVILDMEYIKKNNFCFDEKCQLKFYDSADYDFGLQLIKSKAKGSLNLKMKLFHQETVSLSRFTQRAFARGFLAFYLHQKWNIVQPINNKDSLFIWWLLRFFKHFIYDFKKYSVFMDTYFFKKLLAIVYIKIFERYYTLGYVEAN
jgi:glycosyltransferase involved in cell wall biosynthesis